MTKAWCPCGSGRAYDDCCAPIHLAGAGLGRTAEQLMRARYSAYVRCDEDFLRRSWHPDTQPARVTFDPGLEWLGLEVIRTEAGSGLDTSGVVEFRARFRRGGEYLELHETSRFTRVEGEWVYLDGS